MTPEYWRQIEDLYHAARARSPVERAALLECTDPEIRARVERMLALDSEGQILDRSVGGMLSDPTKTVIGSGTQLGPYQVEAQIGAGGMGTVYRAVDTRLGRVVAIKIAAERYSERFQQEARAISTLNHPHVCTLHDVGPNYLVMELIEGSTLASEIRKGPLAAETAARYGAQIAGALAEAHSLGIVHRDLKPSNVMVTRHGVKVLDFGLAKVLSATGITKTDGVMGTPAYMAPEQVEGSEPGTAADLFSLGLVLYEMSVGRLPFPGASLGQMLSSGSHAKVPAPSRERAGVPASLDGLVAKLLEKDPAKRPQSAGEVARELSAVADRMAARPASGPRPAYLIPVVVVLLLLAAGLYRLRFKVPGSQPPIPNNPAAYTQLTSFTDSAVSPTLSPDGRMLAFYRSDHPFDTPDQIWIKLLPNGEPVQVTHDPRRKYNIAFSPDGSQIAYTVFGFETDTVPTLGGDSKLFLPNSAGLSWLDDSQVLFSELKTGIHMGVVTSKPDRSDLREIYFPAHARGMAHYSYLSPDKKWILLAEMVSEFGPCRVVPFSGGSPGRQVGPGGVCTSGAWSPDGKWMYLTVQVNGRNHLWRQRFPDGQPQQITFGSTEEGGIAMAGDGRSLITSIFTRQNVVWIHDTGGDRALSSEGYADGAPPTFSLDGKRLYYLLHRDSPESPAELVRANLASGKTEVVIPSVSMHEYDVSPDEKEVVYSTVPPGQPSQIWIAPLDRSAPPRKIAENGEGVPHFGPNNEVLFQLTDGKAYYLAAMSRDGSGRRKVFPDPTIDINGVSPDRRMISLVVGHTRAVPVGVVYSLDARSAQQVCDFPCTVAWSPDGRYVYVEIVPASREKPLGRTAAIPVPPGQSFPPIPPAKFYHPEEWAKIPGVKIVEHDGIAPGLDPSTYAYIQASVHSNLYRIPLH
jgi:eukaryotic-like serine/threonine-protein kinase